MSERPLSADYVVIGSGICGSLVARRLAQQGASVLILEAGPRVKRDDIVDAFRDSPRKHDFMAPYPFTPFAPHPDFFPEDNGYLVQAGPHPYPAQYVRVVGGTTWHWAAMAWRNLPNDFAIKSLYGVGVDWPFTYFDLEPFYQEAEEVIGVSGDFDQHNPLTPRSKPFPMEKVAESWAMRRLRERLGAVEPERYKVITNTQARNSVRYDGRPPCCGRNNCMPICPIDAQYTGGAAAESAEDAGALLTPLAVVYRLEHDGVGRIVAAHYFDISTPNPISYRVTGKTFIVAANGIESPKLLLLSASSQYPNGVANSSGLVGRNLMDHPSTTLTFDADEDVWLGRGPTHISTINSQRDVADNRVKFAPYRLDFSNFSRVLGSTQTLLAEGVYGEEFSRRLRHSAAREMEVTSVLEQLPDPANRVALSSKKDALGIPTPELHYSIDDYTRRGAAEAREDFVRIANIMNTQGTGNFRFADEFANNQHICGPLSMGIDPATSVCDQYGRTWDHENLFLVGTAVLPTSATANSTLTAVAVALRTAQHILPRPEVIARA